VAGARYRHFAGHNPPFSFTVIADALFLSSGLLNVLLYVYTRPFLLPHSDSPDDQSIAIHSEFAQSRSDLPVLGSSRVVERDPSPIEPRSADPVYDAPEMASLQHGTLPITTHTGDRDIGHMYEGSGVTLARRGLPTIFDDV
jgi:hypothetical protein